MIYSNISSAQICTYISDISDIDRVMAIFIMSSTYHSLLFAQGLLDFAGSCATSVSTLPMPRTEQTDYSFGTSATCTAQGFFVHFNIASPLYNLSLSIYFFLTIASKWTKGDIKKVEIWLHFLPFLWAFVTALVVLTLEGFNSSKFWYVHEKFKSKTQLKSKSHARILNILVILFRVVMLCYPKVLD